MYSKEENHQYIVDLVKDSKKIKNTYLEKLLNDNPNYEYKIKIEDKDYTFKIKDFINYITIEKMGEYQSASAIYVPTIGMPREHFRYALITFFKELKINFEGVIGERLKAFNDDPAVKLINKVYKSNDPNLDKIRVNPKLKEAIFKGKKKFYTPWMDAMYIYIKMCKLLTYDEEFMVSNQMGASKTLHEDISHIYDITPENNKVVCYEFTAIYSALLKEIGIPSEIVKTSNNYSLYGGEHTKVRFKDNGEIFVADATTSILFGDLFAAKVGLPLSGFIFEKMCDGHTYFDIQNSVNYIYEHIEKEENNLELNVKDINILLKEYSRETDNITNVSLKEKLDILIHMINSTNLKGVDAYSYLIYLKNNVLIGSNVKISIIRDDTKENRTARAIIVIRGIDENDDEYIYYYSYSPKESVKPISLGQLQLMFDTNKFGYINEKERNKIEGVIVRR